MDNKEINVFGYVRVSTENQVKEGHSLEDQYERVVEYCKANNYRLIQVFEDKGISGAKANEDEMTIEREGILNMLSQIKEYEIKYIVVLTTSRLWRSDIVRVVIQRELKRFKSDVRAIDRPNYSIYKTTPNDYLINGMFEILDTYERLEIALKLKRGRLKKANDGGYSGGGTPFGYKAFKGSKGMHIEQSEAKIVRIIFATKERFPEVTLQELTDILNKEGFTSRNGKSINPMLIKRILDKEDFYKGIYKYSDIKTIGKHEPIL